MTDHAAISLSRLGWSDSYQHAFAPYLSTCRPGRVVRVDRGVCTVMAESGPLRASVGGDVLDAMSTDSTQGPCAGDWCAIRVWPDGPTTIEAVLPRHTAIRRAVANRRSEGQVLAANIDVAAVMDSLVPAPALGKLERLLALVWESGAVPVVLLSKADLAADSEQIAADVRAAAPGVDVICCSTVTGLGLDRIRALLDPARTLALVGSSGVGKSSLVNALVGTTVLETREIRDDGRGRHTSVRRELVLLPGGGTVIDMPGLRGVGLIHADDGIATTFADVERLVGSCRFHDCAHSGEPGCAVAAALTEGTLSLRRFESWQKLQREMEWMRRRTDARLAAEDTKKWRKLTKERRNYQRNLP
jgi:ribosome biogenesis GTPase